MPWYIFSALNVLGMATLAVGLRWGLRDGKYNPNLFSIVSLFYAGVLYTLVGLIFGQTLDFSVIPLPNLLFGAVLNVGIFLFVNRAVSLIEIGPYSMIVNLRSVFVIPLAAIFLSEQLGSPLLIGAALVFGAAILVSYQPGQKLRAGPGELYAFLAAICIAAAFINEAVIFEGDQIDPALFLTAEHFMAGAILLYVYRNSLPKLRSYIGQKEFHVRQFIPTFGLTVGLMSIFAAFKSDTDISLLIAISQSASVVAVLASIVLLGEKSRLGYKLGAALISFVGLLILTIS